jgi:hypothetical protein
MADHIWPDNPFKRKLSIRAAYLSEVVQDQNIESAGEMGGGEGEGGIPETIFPWEQERSNLVKNVRNARHPSRRNSVYTPLGGGFTLISIDI